MKRREQKMLTVMGALLMVCLLCSGCASKPSLTGKWKMTSGSLSTIYTSYNQCMLEFTDDGQYTIYAGDLYYEDRCGSYSLDNKQITLIMDNVLNSKYNYKRDGDDLTIISSDGTASFHKFVDDGQVKVSFDSSMVAQEYLDKGLDVRNITLVSDKEQEKVYQYEVVGHYGLVDESTTYRQAFQYSTAGEKWYCTDNSKIGDPVETWNILQTFTYKDDDRASEEDTLTILSFDPITGEMQIQYRRAPRKEGYFSPSQDEKTFSGTVVMARSSWGDYSGDFISVDAAGNSRRHDLYMSRGTIYMGQPGSLEYFYGSP